MSTKLLSPERLEEIKKYEVPCYTGDAPCDSCKLARELLDHIAYQSEQVSQARAQAFEEAAKLCEAQAKAYYDMMEGQDHDDFMRFDFGVRVATRLGATIRALTKQNVPERSHNLGKGT